VNITISYSNSKNTKSHIDLELGLMNPHFLISSLSEVQLLMEECSQAGIEIKIKINLNQFIKGQSLRGSSKQDNQALLRERWKKTRISSELEGMIESFR
jgi:hypothetical protein